jgi:putative endonuclease
MERGACVYILSNQHLTVYYTGVTSDLVSRLIQHKTKYYPKSFTARYNIDRLLYYESFHSVEEAIAREKQIKKYSRVKKLKLIHAVNPAMHDLWDEIKDW